MRMSSSSARPNIRSSFVKPNTKASLWSMIVTSTSSGTSSDSRVASSRTANPAPRITTLFMPPPPEAAPHGGQRSAVWPTKPSVAFPEGTLVQASVITGRSIRHEDSVHGCAGLSVRQRFQHGGQLVETRGPAVDRREREVAVGEQLEPRFVVRDVHAEDTDEPDLLVDQEVHVGAGRHGASADARHDNGPFAAHDAERLVERGGGLRRDVHDHVRAAADGSTEGTGRILFGDVHNEV